jgi:ketosteroid isomerase-like protein
MSVEPLIRFFETLSEGTVARIPDFYSDDARFKDPFNDVRGTSAIQRIFTHMFTQVSEPCFVVGERVVDATGAVLVWDFHFGVRCWGSVRTQVIHGVSHLKFAADGKVTCHRDYWDTGEELYMKLPVLGLLMRALRSRLAA